MDNMKETIAARIISYNAVVDRALAMATTLPEASERRIIEAIESGEVVRFLFLLKAMSKEITLEELLVHLTDLETRLSIAVENTAKLLELARSKSFFQSSRMEVV
jgi:hypothetical protein